MFYKLLLKSLAAKRWCQENVLRGVISFWVFWDRKERYMIENCLKKVFLGVLSYYWNIELYFLHLTRQELIALSWMRDIPVKSKRDRREIKYILDQNWWTVPAEIWNGLNIFPGSSLAVLSRLFLVQLLLPHNRVAQSWQLIKQPKRTVSNASNQILLPLQQKLNYY